MTFRRGSIIIIDMNLKNIEKYWLKASNEDLSTAVTLQRNKKFVPAMFFLHLAIEKNLKSLFVQINSKEPPFTHNLIKLLESLGDIPLDSATKTLMAEISAFNISARYDDYKNSFAKTCTMKFSKE